MGSKSQTTVQKADPWGPIQPFLKDVAADAKSLYQQGGFAADPYAGPRVGGFSDTTQQAHQMMLDRAAGGSPLLDTAGGTLTSMMDPNYRTSQLEAVKNNALGAAIPAAVSQFAGSGMTNSTMAMDTVGRAATDAVAPYEYGAFESAQGRALQAANMAPAMEAAGYIPSQMVGAVGGQRDAMTQAMIDAEMAKYYETENQPLTGLQNYGNLLMGLGGMGGTSSATAPGPSFGQQLGGAALGGLGTYGMLAANPVTAPFALLGGIGSGLLGLF